MSLRARLTIALVALLAAGLVTADVATFMALRSYLDGQVGQQLRQATTAAVSATRSPPERDGDHHDGDGPAGPETIDVQGLQPGTFVQIRDATGAVTYQSTSASGGAAARPSLPVTLPATGTELSLPAADPAGPPYRVLVTATGGGTVVVAVPLAGMNDTLAGLVRIEAVVSATVLALAAVTALAIARVGLRPLDEIGGAAADIAAGDLSRRIERDDEKPEIGRLGHSLNTMMGQIESAFAHREASEERVRRFAADASHELRTPLAAVQAYAELFERAVDHPEDLPRLMRAIRTESARMGALLDDLLLLTRLDQGRPLDRRPVDLGAIAADATEAARAVDPTRPITLTVAGSVEVEGDRLRLRQIVDNLLANVRVHTPPGTPVELTVSADGPRADLTVADHGPGIDEAQRPHIFERFYRTDPARSRSDGGSGLGLSIVAAITRAHDGEVSVSSPAGGGAGFHVRLPRLGASGAGQAG